MILYQQRTLVPAAAVGVAAPLPGNLAHLSDAQLADLDATLGRIAAKALGYGGQGFVAVPDPLARWLHKAIVKRRLTAAERIAIRAAALSDPIIGDFMDLLDSADLVFLDDADLAAGLGYLVSVGLLGAGRVAEILI